MSSADAPPERLRRGDSLTATVASIAAGGDAFARVNNVAVFFDRGLPGDEVTAEVTHAKKRFARARVTRVVRGPDAAPPACSVADACGGCRFQHAAYADELAWKTAAVAESVRRIGRDVEWPTPTVTPSRSPEGYRARARFRLTGEGATGFRAAGSHDVVPADRCVVVHPGIEEVRRTGAAIFAGLPRLESLFFEWDEARGGVALTGEFNARDITKTLRTLRARVARSNGRMQAFTTIVAAAQGRPHVLLGDGCVERWRDTDGGVARVRDPVTAFSQANVATNADLVDAVMAAVCKGAAGLADPAEGSASAVDLFAGSGNLTFPMLAAGFDVDAIDIAAGPVAAAATAWKDGPGSSPARRARFHVGDLAGGLSGAPLDRLREADVIVTDPPRGGMSPALTEQLARDAERARAIVYVSCDPPAMARDVAALAAHGWTVDEWRLVDMFPRTPHLEAVALLTPPR